MLQFGEIEVGWLSDGMRLLIRKEGQLLISDPDGSVKNASGEIELETPASQNRLEKLTVQNGQLYWDGKQISGAEQSVFEVFLLSHGADVYYSAFLDDGTRQVFRWTPGKEPEQITSRHGLFRCLPNRDGESLAIFFENPETQEWSLFRMDGPKMKRLF